MITADKAREITDKNQDKSPINNIMHVVEQRIRDDSTNGYSSSFIRLNEKYVPHAAEVVKLLLEYGFEATFTVSSHRNETVAHIKISW